MSAIAEKKRRLREANRPQFDVVVLNKVGTVYLDGDSNQTPHEAAFQLIARHDQDGTYRFPSPDGVNYIQVAVTTVGPDADALPA